MPEKDNQEQAVTISEQKIVSRLTSDAPPPYSEVMTHDWTVKNDPKRSLAPPYEPPCIPMTNVTSEPVVQNSYSVNGEATNVSPAVVRTPPTSAPERTREQPSAEYELQMQLSYNMDKRIMGMIAGLLVFFIMGTPLTLFFTVPGLYCIYKVGVYRCEPYHHCCI